MAKRDYYSFKNIVESNDCKLITNYSDYQNIKSYEKIYFLCNCGNTFYTTWGHFEEGKTRCNKCSGYVRWKYEQVKQYIENNNCKLKSTKPEYKNASTKLCIECKCGNIYKRSFSHFKNKKAYTCKQCSVDKNASKQRSNTKEFKDKVYKLCKNEYTVIGKYEGALTKIKMRHNCEKCSNYEYEVTPSKFVNSNNRCPKCFGSIKKTTSEFKKEIFDLIGNEYELLSEYKNSKTKVKFKHNKCEHVFEMKPQSFISDSHRCPLCNSSKAEKVIYNLLKDKKIKFNMEHTFEDCRYKKPLHFDFAIFKDNRLMFLIEYDGIGHYEPFRFNNQSEKKNIEEFNMRKIRDKIKDDYCKQNNIRLLRIPYWKLKNIEEILDLKIKEWL